MTVDSAVLNRVFYCIQTMFQTRKANCLTVRFDMSKCLVVSTWGQKRPPPTSISDIFVGTKDILMFISPQNTKRDKLRCCFLKFLQLVKLVIIRQKSWGGFSPLPIVTAVAVSSSTGVSAMPIFAASARLAAWRRSSYELS